MFIVCEIIVLFYHHLLWHKTGNHVIAVKEICGLHDLPSSFTSIISQMSLDISAKVKTSVFKYFCHIMWASNMHFHLLPEMFKLGTVYWFLTYQPKILWRKSVCYNCVHSKLICHNLKKIIDLLDPSKMTSVCVGGTA